MKAVVLLALLGISFTIVSVPFNPVHESPEERMAYIKHLKAFKFLHGTQNVPISKYMDAQY